MEYTEALAIIGKIVDNKPRSINVLYPPHPENESNKVKIILHINMGPHDSQTIEVPGESLESAVMSLYEALKNRTIYARQRLKDTERWLLLMQSHIESMQKNTPDIPPNTQG